MTSTNGIRASEPAVAVRDVTFTYGDRTALDAVTLETTPGTVAGLLGPNGSGKSTLLSVVMGLRTPLSGDIRIHGRIPSPALRRDVGVVFQEQGLDPLMTLSETLTLHGRLFGLRGGDMRRRIDSLLQRFGLAERAGDSIGTLSGGLRRRVELARALLPEPSLLLLDEPTTGLDPDARRSFWEQLQTVRGEGLTLLLATNDVQEAERVCDTVAFLHHGRLVAEGTPAELKRGLKSDSVRLECSEDGGGGQAAELAARVRDWPGVGAATTAGAIVHITVDDVSAFVPRLFQNDAALIRNLHIQASTLEDAYFQIAGETLQALAQDEAGAVI